MSYRTLLLALLAAGWILPHAWAGPKDDARREIREAQRRGDISGREAAELNREVNRATNREVEDALDDLSRPSRPSNNYRPNNYYPTPAPAPAPPPVPTNAAPAQVLTAPKNVLLGEAKAATALQVEDLLKQVSSHIVKEQDALEKLAGQIAVTREFRRTLAARLNGEGNNPALVDELDSRLGDRAPDVRAVDGLLAQLDLDVASRSNILGRLELPELFTRLKRQVQDGKDVNTVLEEIRQGLARSAGDASSDAVAAQLDRLGQACSILKTLSNTPRTGVAQQVKWPAGRVQVVYNPKLAPGELYVVGPGVLLAGTSQTDVRVTESTVAGAMNLPSEVDAAPLPDLESAAMPAADVVLANPADTRVAVSYQIAGTNHKLDPNFELRHTVAAGATLTIDFNKGGTAGMGRYALKAGTYKFWVKNGAWDIAPVGFKIVIDNQTNPRDINYLLNGKPQVVKARQRQEHTSAYPFTLMLDRGNGGKAAIKRLGDGVYRVAVGRELGWDLFKAE